MQLKILKDRIPAEFLSFAIPAVFAHPDFIELLHDRFHQCGVAGDDPRLKIPGVCMFHAKPGACEICGTRVSQFPVNDDVLEMYPRAELSFHALNKQGILIKAVPEVGSGFLCVQQSDGYTFSAQVVQQGQERYCPAPVWYMHILGIRCADPYEGSCTDNGFNGLPE